MSHTASLCAASRAWIELDIKNLCNNAGILKSKLPKDCRLMPAVKANAYGHGMIPVTKELMRQGLHNYCVATLSEAVSLRESGVSGEILILGYTAPQDADFLSHYRLIQTVIDTTYAKSLSDSAKHPVTVHIAIDTGMHRLGIPYDCYTEVLDIFKLNRLKVTGIFSHLCIADRMDVKAVLYSEKQKRALDDVCKYLSENGHTVSVHILNSAGIIHFPYFGGDFARPGIALYGVGSDREDVITREADLKPVLSLKARIAHITELPPGDGIGYGREIIGAGKRTIAVLAIGYADGVPRAMSCGNGFVLIKGKKARIVGKICMDQMFADITDIPDVAQGDIAVLIGRDGGNEISVYSIAEQAGTITNDVLSGLGERLIRIAV